MSNPAAHVTQLQGKDMMYSTEFGATGCLVSIFFLSIYLSSCLSEKRGKKEASTFSLSFSLSHGELVKSHLLVKRNVLIFMISVFTSVRRAGLHHCFKIAAEISALSKDSKVALFKKQ